MIVAIMGRGGGERGRSGRNNKKNLELMMQSNKIESQMHVYSYYRTIFASFASSVINKIRMSALTHSQ